MEELLYKKNESIKLLMEIPEVLCGNKIITNEKIKKCDINYMSEIAIQQKILTSFLLVFEDYLSENLKKICYERRENLYARVSKQKKLLQILKEKFKEKNIEYVVIKGMPISQYIYSDIKIREFNDLDIVIDEDKFEIANQIMIELGFKSSLNNNKIPNIRTLECYEIDYKYPFTEGGKLSKEFKNELSVELKVGTSSIKNKDLINNFMKNKVIMSIEEIQIYTLNINDTFILLCTNTYGNFEEEFAKARFRDFVDIYIYIYIYEKSLDWEYIFETTKKYEITHQIYAIFNLMKKYYIGFNSNKFIELFSLDKITYDKSKFHNYEHGWMRDWNISFIDMMLDKRMHRAEMYYQHSVKSYSSRNQNFNKKIFLNNLDFEGEFKKEALWLKGFRSIENELEYEYRFGHNYEKIYFELKFQKYNKNSNIKTVLIIFDINRRIPRKMIEFFYEDGMIKSKSLIDDFKIIEEKKSKDRILISMNKKQFNVLLNKGKVLSYRIYSVKRFYDTVDFAINDSLNIFNFNNPHLLYLNSDK